ncbi:hypothetical protein H4S02_001708 [Coemansia sp. RSA 2611]|nr:hypothetical protein IWW54_001873 [Coemansia sp. RSA 2705]KAJ2319750.1 hypothetical protein IWW52_001786 [Coemansia sp. RSA 2704]KAJ2367472.1 hypothetical protein H4S01_002143 [Coemansia sp. RSA 2610]KAJ2390716.1 hypothetical protein H4S02_001708 [Coemansia sp. RSA 2611]KAJ2739219.1 hypothetical protein H4R23_000619 [Coemansia sp. Cherry 401B]
MSAKDELAARAVKSVDSSSLHLLVYSYLLHNNCGRTAQAFARTCGLATSGRLASADTPAYLSTIFNAVDEDISVDAVPVKAKGKETQAKLPAIVEAVDAPQPARKDSGMESDGERAHELIDHHIEYLKIRQSICTSIEAGEPEVASDLLTTYFRPVLIPPPAGTQPAVNSLPVRREFNATLLRFRLDTQYYVELIANHQELDALQFGQRTLWRYPDIFDTWLEHSLGFAAPALHPLNGALHSEPSADDHDDDIVPRDELKLKRAEIMQHITDVAALVAYPDPRKSTLAYLLSQERRRELAEAVNAAILRSMKFPREPAMVTLVRQLATTSAYLVGYRSSSRSPEERPQSSRQPWVLGAFVNSDSFA